MHGASGQQGSDKMTDHEEVVLPPQIRDRVGARTLSPDPCPLSLPQERAWGAFLTLIGTSRPLLDAPNEREQCGHLSRVRSHEGSGSLGAAR
jgi:hypothetical protein